MNRTYFASLALFASLASMAFLAAVGATKASAGDGDTVIAFGPAPDAAEDQKPGGAYEGRVHPDFTIASEVQSIERGMTHFTTLSDTLGSASAELAADFEAYLKDPKNEVLASGIEKKMALFADQAVRDFDRITGDQDVLLSNFKVLTRKLGRIDGALGDKSADFEIKLDSIREDATAIEQKLIKLAVEIKEAVDDPEKKRALESDFARQYRHFRLRNRNIRQYEHSLKNYTVLLKNLTLLTQLFSQLEDKFADLVANLEHEKSYLLDAIEMKQEETRIKKIMSEGLFGGERAIKNVTEKLAQLYLRVDAFTQVHDRINSGLGRFEEVQVTLEQLSKTIDEIGNGGITMPGLGSAGAEASLAEAVDFFYKQRGKLKN